MTDDDKTYAMDWLRDQIIIIDGQIEKVGGDNPAKTLLAMITPTPAALPVSGEIEKALKAYNSVWDAAKDVDAHTAPGVRKEAMTAALAALRSHPQAPASDEEVERLARIIDPAIWDVFDKFLAPFVEGRGSRGFEPHETYAAAWRFGARTAKGAKEWFVHHNETSDRDFIRASLAAARRVAALSPSQPASGEGKLREALKPFAALLDTDSNGYESSPDDAIVRSVGTFGRDYVHITVGDLRRAREVLLSTPASAIDPRP